MPNEKSSASSPVRTTKLRDGIVDSVAPTRLMEDALRVALRDLQALGAGPIWLFDCSATESFETACVKLIAGALPELERRGLRRVIAVLKTPGMRMAARAVAVASRVEIKVVDSRLEAATYFAFK